MFLALREIRRAKLRFFLLILSIALLVFLILFQNSIQNALIRSFVGGVENQTAPVVVFNIDGRRTPQASMITPTLESKIVNTAGVGDTAKIWASTFPVKADNTTTATSVIGYEAAELGAPAKLVAGRLPESPDEAVANATDKTRGYDIDSIVSIQPNDTKIRIVGLADQAGIAVLPTIWTTDAGYLRVLQNRFSTDTLPPANVIGVSPKNSSAQELATSLNNSDADIDALTKKDAAAKNPGVANIKQSFTVIFLLFGLVVPLVTGLFFLILTFQKAGSLTLLRALGAKPKVIVKALMIQVAIVLGLGMGIALLGYTLISSQQLDTIPLRFERTSVILWVTTLSVLAVISALASVRRILAIDPIEATTGSGVCS